MHARETTGDPTLFEAFGEILGVPERMVVAPAAGRFRSLDRELVATTVDVGAVLGTIEAPRQVTPVRSPFRGELVRMLALPGELLRPGQGVAWLVLA